MTAPTQTLDRTTRATAALTIEAVTLRVRDLDRTARFYEQVIGLAPIATATDRVDLAGASGARLVTLVGDATAPLASPRAAGLFHTAFLLPSRQALGSWLANAAGLDVALEGASDHSVSEAIYLSDPEGNGIEVYADRPRDQWRWAADGVAMTTIRLDLQALLADAGEAAGPKIGHMHLKVGDVFAAETFWTEALGLTVTARRPGAVFMAHGGYHHHVAANTWGSAGAGKRDPAATGLVSFEVLGGAALPGAFTDPWGNQGVVRCC